MLRNTKINAPKIITNDHLLNG